MNKKNASNPRRLGHEHIPELDDYELPPHIEVDYSKAKPNRFAGRVKFTHGGKRTGAGRKPRFGASLIQKTVRLTREEIDYLVELGGNLSEGIHRLIQSQRASKWVNHSAPIRQSKTLSFTQQLIRFVAVTHEHV